MVRFVSALVIAALVLTAFPLYASAAPMPWDTFAKGERSMARDVVRSGVQECPGGEIYVAAAVVGPRDNPAASYVMAYAPSTGMVVFAYDPNPGDPSAPPAELGVGKMNPDKSDAVPALVWSPYRGDPSEHPCRLLFPEKS